MIILVTDGMRTAGRLNPVEAAELAAKMGVKIHTIGIGGTGPAPFASRSIFGRTQFRYQDVPLDEKTLSQIAEKTGGLYFNAQSTEQLSQVYAQLDALETREEQREEYVEYQEQYQWFVAAALIPLLLYMVFRFAVWVEIT